MTAEETLADWNRQLLAVRATLLRSSGNGQPPMWVDARAMATRLIDPAGDTDE
jgi:hypothetical protein